MATSSIDGTLRGFAKWSLSKFSVDDFTNETRPEGDYRPEDGYCYYRDFRGSHDEVNITNQNSAILGAENNCSASCCVAWTDGEKFLFYKVSLYLTK